MMFHDEPSAIVRDLVEDRNWVLVLDLAGSRFYQSTIYPELYQRIWHTPSAPPGRVEHVRIACDDVVVSTYYDAALRLIAVRR